MTPLARLVRGSIRCRFTVDEDAFARLIEDKARRTPASDPVEFARGLALDDLYLATSCLAGDERAWQECRDRFFEYLHRFARRFLDDSAAVEIRDQVFAELWQRRRFAQYDGRSSLRTWLGALVAHAAINARRAAVRAVAFHDGGIRSAPGAPDDADTADTLADRRAFAAIVLRALTTLDADSRLLLLLYYDQGLTLDEMTVILHASKATLSRRLERVRGALRGAIDTMARDEMDATAVELARGLDLARLELDLSTVLGAGPMKKGR